MNGAFPEQGKAPFVVSGGRVAKIEAMNDLSVYHWTIPGYILELPVLQSIYPMTSTTIELRRFVSFLNAMPTTCRTDEWLLAFRTALRAFLGDVDRVSVNVNIGCDPGGDGIERDFTAYFMQAFVPGARDAPDLAIGACPAGTHHYERLIEVSYRHLPKELYHPVHATDYLHNGAYLGSVLLWRERRNRPIREETLRLLEELRPFIVFVLSDAIARFRVVRPGHRTIERVATLLRKEVGLTQREWEVLRLHMAGLTYKEIAACLNVSVVAVKKRIGGIHRKAGVENQFELFARYFTGRMFEPIGSHGARPS